MGLENKPTSGPAVGNDPLGAAGVVLAAEVASVAAGAGAGAAGVGRWLLLPKRPPAEAVLFTEAVVVEAVYDAAGGPKRPPPAPIVGVEAV